MRLPLLVFGLRLLVRDLPQGPLLMAATLRGSPEGGHRTEYLLQCDLRVGRGFEAGPGTLRVALDVFNVLNRAAKLRENDLSGPRFNERLPLTVQPPRFLRVGLEYRF